MNKIISILPIGEEGNHMLYLSNGIKIEIESHSHLHHEISYEWEISNDPDELRENAKALISFIETFEILKDVCPNLVLESDTMDTGNPYWWVTIDKFELADLIYNSKQ